jgi:rubrerythrin
MADAFGMAWIISKKSWDDLEEGEDEGWTGNIWVCRGCNYEMTPEEWEMRNCPQCGTRNTLHPSMR